MFNEFWNDPKQMREFSPEDRYVYLWCLTNPHGNLCGCYTVTLERAAQELGYTYDAALRIIVRLDRLHQMIRYSYKTHEMLVLHWQQLCHDVAGQKANTLDAEIQRVKNPAFREYLQAVYGVPPLEAQGDIAKKKEENSMPQQEQELKPKPKPAAKPKKADVFADFAGDNKELLDALRDYEKMRNTKDRPMTDRARKILVNKLRREFSPEEWIAVLDQSIFRGWDSVYKLDDNSGQKKNSTDYSEDPSDIDLLLGEGGDTQ